MTPRTSAVAHIQAHFLVGAHTRRLATEMHGHHDEALLKLREDKEKEALLNVSCKLGKIRHASNNNQIQTQVSINTLPPDEFTVIPRVLNTS